MHLPKFTSNKKKKMTILGSTTKFVVKLCPKCNYVRPKKIQSGQNFYLRIKNHNLKKIIYNNNYYFFQVKVVLYSDYPGPNVELPLEDRDIIIMFLFYLYLFWHKKKYWSYQLQVDLTLKILGKDHRICNLFRMIYFLPELSRVKPNQLELFATFI